MINKENNFEKDINVPRKEQIIIDGKIIGCPCYIDRPLHRYHKGCLVQSQAFKEQQTEEKPILRCDEIKNCPIKENFKQLQCKTAECEKLKVQLKNSENARNYAEKVCIDIELKKKIYKQALDSIVATIKDLENENIVTFPDFSLKENCKIIMGQCNKGYVDILDIINKAKGEIIIQEK